MSPPRIIPVAPTHTEKTMAFVCPGGLREVDVERYPPHPRGHVLLQMRHAFDFMLRDAVAIVGVSPSEYSGLERGSHTLENDTAWCDLYGAFAEEYARRERERLGRDGGR